MQIDFVINLVEQARTPVRVVVVVHGTVIRGTVVPRNEFDDWLLAQFSAALEEHGYSVAQRDVSQGDEDPAVVVQGTAADPKTIALKDVLIQNGQTVYEVPFLSVNRTSVDAFTVGSARAH